jgi:hypothetical protein
MIFGRHSVLKRGCSTWDPEQVPQELFQSRLKAVREEMARRNLDALVIYGDNYSFADLCYLTNYFPKVRGASPWCRVTARFRCCSISAAAMCRSPRL